MAKKIVVNDDACIGCGTCAVLAPKTFKVGDDGKVKVIDPNGDDEKTIQEAVESCPVGAIILKEE